MGPYLAAINFLVCSCNSLDTLKESVRIYVIKPTVCPEISIPSYRCWAVIMVFWEENPSLLYASCCMELVIKGGFGFCFTSFFSTFSTVLGPLRRSALTGARVSGLSNTVDFTL